MDISIKNNKDIFKYRVNGILIKDNKILTVQIMNNGVYCCPGGHVKIGESSNEAVKREMLEETSLTVEVEYPIAFIENFFERNSNNLIHEISLYYLVKASNIATKNYEILENDDGIEKKLEFRWIPIEELDKYNFRPQDLIEKIKKKDYTFTYINNKK